jgi:hypothetical protein
MKEIEMDEAQRDKRSEDGVEISVEYANNTMFEPTIWDLKLIFGEWSGRSNSIEYHTSITVPWAQAKLIMYYLRANIAAHEVINGRIKIPQEVMPPEWTPPAPEQQTGEQKSEEIFKALQQVREEFMESLK